MFPMSMMSTYTVILFLSKVILKDPLLGSIERGAFSLLWYLSCIVLRAVGKMLLKWKALEHFFPQRLGDQLMNQLLLVGSLVGIPSHSVFTKKSSLRALMLPWIPTSSLLLPLSVLLYSQCCYGLVGLPRSRFSSYLCALICFAEWTRILLFEKIIRLISDSASHHFRNNANNWRAMPALWVIRNERSLIDQHIYFSSCSHCCCAYLHSRSSLKLHSYNG